MNVLDDNPKQANKGQENSTDNSNQNPFNEDSQKQGIIPDAERVEKDSEGKFSPGEYPNYNGDEFSTD